MEESMCLTPVSSQEKQQPMHRAYLHFNAILPLFVMVLCLGYWKNIVLAVFVFQIICMIILPFIYITCMMQNGLKTYEVLFRHLLRNSSNQWPLAVVGFLTCVIGGFGIFLGIQSFHFIVRKEVVSEAESDGLNGKEFPSTWMIVAAALEFTFVNSFLEEFFWRVYLYRELAGYTEEDMSQLLPKTGRNSYDGSIDEETGLKEGNNSSRHSSSSGGGITIDLNQQSNEYNAEFSRFGGGISIFGLPMNETPKILMSCYYASYHVVILLCFVQWWLALVGFLGLVFLGRCFVYCRENERFGVVTGWGLHAGLDGAFCVIMAQLYFRFV